MSPLTTYGFIDRVLAKPRGQIVLANLTNGLNQGLFHHKDARNVVDAWMNEFCRKFKTVLKGGLSEGREEDELINCLETIKKVFRVKCQRRPRRSCKARGFGTVIHAGTLIAHYMSEHDRRRLSASGAITGLSISAPAAETEIDALMSLRRRQVNLRPNQVIGNPESVLWITPLEEVQKHLVGTEAAERVRDGLGLIHRDRLHEPLVLLELPASAVAGTTNGRPTFADAGSHRRFKTHVDGKAKSKRSAWGHTVDLERLAGGNTLIDGHPERVCMPVPTAMLGRIEFVPLGKIRFVRTEQTGRDDDPAFAQRLVAHAGGLAKIRNTVRGL